MVNPMVPNSAIVAWWLPGVICAMDWPLCVSAWLVGLFPVNFPRCVSCVWGVAIRCSCKCVMLLFAHFVFARCVFLFLSMPPYVSFHVYIILWVFKHAAYFTFAFCASLRRSTVARFGAWRIVSVRLYLSSSDCDVFRFLDLVCWCRALLFHDGSVEIGVFNPPEAGVVGRNYHLGIVGVLFFVGRWWGWHVLGFEWRMFLPLHGRKCRWDLTRCISAVHVLGTPLTPRKAEMGTKHISQAYKKWPKASIGAKDLQ